MKRSNITRKTPIKRGRKPMAKKSKTNSRKFQDSVLREAYRQNNPECELTPWFKANFTSLQIVDRSLDLHHIRKLGRKDCWSNFIRVARSIHEWDAVRPVEMAIICIWTKWRKQEINWTELDKCGNGTVAGWLGRHRPEIEVFVSPWNDLMGALQ